MAPSKLFILGQQSKQSFNQNPSFNSFLMLYRSPDLSGLDYAVWGTMRAYVYDPKKPKIRSLRVLLKRIKEAANSFKHSTIHRITNDEFKKRLLLCKKEKGGHFEHLVN